MKLYYSAVIEIADFWHGINNNAERPLRWLKEHAEKADPAIAAATAMEMAKRVMPNDQTDLMKIFYVQNSRLEREDHMLALALANNAAHAESYDIAKVGKRQFVSMADRHESELPVFEALCDFVVHHGDKKMLGWELHNFLMATLVISAEAVVRKGGDEMKPTVCNDLRMLLHSPNVDGGAASMLYERGLC